MKEYKVAATIIYHPEDYFILHRRKAGNDNGELGKLGLYGGKFDEEKGDKTFNDTASRELNEESGVLIHPENFIHEGYVIVTSERDKEDVLVEAEIFSLRRGIEFELSQFRDGERLTLRGITRAIALAGLTPVAEAAFTKLQGA